MESSEDVRERSPLLEVDRHGRPDHDRHYGRPRSEVERHWCPAGQDRQWRPGAVKEDQRYRMPGMEDERHWSPDKGDKRHWRQDKESQRHLRQGMEEERYWRPAIDDERYLSQAKENERHWRPEKENQRHSRQGQATRWSFHTEKSLQERRRRKEAAATAKEKEVAAGKEKPKLKARRFLRRINKQCQQVRKHNGNNHLYTDGI